MHTSQDAHLAEIDREARTQIEILTAELAKQRGIDELKANNSMLWTQEMNNCRAHAEKITIDELINRQTNAAEDKISSAALLILAIRHTYGNPKNPWKYETDRDIIILKLKGKTQSGIAKALGFSQGAIAKRLKKIKANFDAFVNETTQPFNPHF